LGGEDPRSKKEKKSVKDQITCKDCNQTDKVALPLTLQAVRAGSGANRFLHRAVSVLVPPHGLLRDAIPLSMLNLGFMSAYMICFFLSELFFCFLSPLPPLSTFLSN